MIYTIAIDGPVGAGKSSVADGVAQRLGILHLDTGAMYRAFAWKALQEGISPEDEKALVALTARALPEVRYENGAQRTLIGGQDVTDLIRTPEISMAASTSSKFSGVRKAMVARQQEMARKQSMLLDGRDIGTVVLKDATLKVYLTASPEVRARRRYNEMIAKGQETDFDTVLADVIRRDEQDMNREVDPLRPAEDAILVDSSDRNQEQVVEHIVKMVRLRTGHKPAKAEKFTFTYRIARDLIWLLSHTVCPITYHNTEKAQLAAPFILISNHNSMLDPLIMALPIYSYHVRFLGKKELQEKKWSRWLLVDRLLMTPVDRHAMDMSAMRTCLKVLKEKHVLGIFPEGTRHKEGVMQDLESGTAMMAMMGRVPMVPVLIDGKMKLFRRLHVYFGDPISLSDLTAKGINAKASEAADERIRETYREMLKKAHQK